MGGCCWHALSLLVVDSAAFKKIAKRRNQLDPGLRRGNEVAASSGKRKAGCGCGCGCGCSCSCSCGLRWGNEPSCLRWGDDVMDFVGETSAPRLINQCTPTTQGVKSPITRQLHINRQKVTTGGGNGRWAFGVGFGPSRHGDAGEVPTPSQFLKLLARGRHREVTFWSVPSPASYCHHSAAVGATRATHPPLHRQLSTGLGDSSQDVLKRRMRGGSTCWRACPSPAWRRAWEQESANPSPFANASQTPQCVTRVTGLPALAGTRPVTRISGWHEPCNGFHTLPAVVEAATR